MLLGLQGLREKAFAMSYIWEGSRFNTCNFIFLLAEDPLNSMNEKGIKKRVLTDGVQEKGHHGRFSGQQCLWNHSWGLGTEELFWKWSHYLRKVSRKYPPPGEASLMRHLLLHSSPLPIFAYYTPTVIIIT